MKKIEAIIKPYKLEEAMNAVAADGLSLGMTVFEVRGFGRQRGHKETYRGSEYCLDFLPKVMVVFLVRDEDVERTIDAISRATNDGGIGSGKIIVTDVVDVVRIRTGERGEAAI